MSSSNFNKGEWPNDSKDVAEDYELEEMPDSKKRKLWYECTSIATDAQDATTSPVTARFNGPRWRDPSSQG